MSTVLAAAAQRRRSTASTAILLAENAVRLGVTAAISFWLARRLGPAQFGVLNFATALLAIFGVAAAMGLEVPAVLRLAGSDAASQQRLLASLLGVRLVAALAGTGLAIGIAVLVQAQDAQAQAVSVIVSLALVAQVPSVFDFWFKSRVDATPPAIARVTSTLASAALKWWVVEQDLGLVALAWTVVAEAIVGSALLWHGWRRAQGTGRRDLSFDRELAVSLARQSLPFAATNIVVMLYMKADVVLLGALAGHEQTGLYTLVQKLSEVLYVVPVVLVDSAYPRLARQRSGADGQLLFDLAVGSALIVAAIAAMAGGPLVRAVFGERYQASSQLIAWHAWTCVFLALDVARLRWLAAQGLQHYAFPLAALGAATGITMNLLLVPSHGAFGATLSALAAFAATAVVGTLLFPALRGTARMQWRALWPFGRLLAMRRVR